MMKTRVGKGMTDTQLFMLQRSESLNSPRRDNKTAPLLGNKNIRFDGRKIRKFRTELHDTIWIMDCVRDRRT